MQASAGTAFSLIVSENIQQTPELIGQIAAFLCCSCLDLLGLVMAVLD